MMNIGDTIKSAGKTSPSVTGTIKAIVDGKIYQDVLMPPGVNLTVWYTNFPDWREKKVYLVEKDFEDVSLFKEEIDKLKAEGLWDDRYKRSYKLRKYVYFVEDEVEQFNWVEDLEKRL